MRSSFTGTSRDAAHERSLAQGGVQHSHDESMALPARKSVLRKSILDTLDDLGREHQTRAGGTPPLNPSKPLKQHVLQTLTFARLSIVACVLFGTIMGMHSIPQNSFRTKNAWSDMAPNLPACRRLCEKTHFDNRYTQLFGGVGVCEEVQFFLCRMESDDCVVNTDEIISLETMEALGKHRTKCTFPVCPPKAHPYLVMGTLCISVMLIIQGLAAEVALLGGCFVLVATDVLSFDDAFKGLASSSIISMACLFPIAMAMEETGFLDMAVSSMLGMPRNLTFAAWRMMLPVVVLSAFFNNTPTVAMMIPVIVSWSRRLRCHPGKLLMPLSYAAQMGGLLTIIGSSTTMMCRASVSSFFNMDFFTPAPVNFVLFLTTGTAISLFVPTMLHSSAAAENGAKGKNSLEEFKAYEILLEVSENGPLVGTPMDQLQPNLAMTPGVVWLRLGSGGIEDDEPLQVPAGARVRALATARGVACLRHVRGLQLATHHELSLMGTRRRQRQLYECTLSETGLSSLEPEVLRNEFGLALVACRRPQVIEGKANQPWIGGIGGSIQKRDILLVEADSTYVSRFAERWIAAFDMVLPVPDSTPPRTGHAVDKHRAIFTSVGLVWLILVSGLNFMDLEVAAGLLLMALMTVRALSLECVYHSIRVSVLLTIAGASGIATAMEKTGVARWLASVVMSEALPYGITAVYVSLYLLAAFLSLWINNTAVVGILAPMLPPMHALAPEHPVSNLVFIMLAGAGNCFASPLGYQTNMMVMDIGEYTFTDFLRFGLPVQFVHGLSAVLLVPMLPVVP